MKLTFLFILSLIPLRAQEKQPMIQSITPNLMVQDVNRSVEFYRNNFGFELVTTVPDSGRFDWAMMKHGTVEIMFQTVESITKDLPELSRNTPGGALTFYTRVKDVKQLYDKVKTKVTIVHGLQNTFYGMEEFTIKDLDGYFLTFASKAH